jgi:carbamoyl-phosphate synthase large subunit
MIPITVLLTSAGVATAVNVIHALRRSTIFDVRIIAVDMNPLSAGLYLADDRYLAPPASEPGYTDKLVTICMREKVNFLFPLFSGEIGIIARDVEKFCRNDINVMIPSPEVVELCTNKNSFINFLKQNNYPYPETMAHNDVKPDSVPLFIKPVRGSSSKNTFLIEDKEALHFYLKRYPQSIIQKYISGMEYTVDCLVYGGVIYVCSPRSRLNVKDGKSMVGKTVSHAGVITLVSDLLQAIGMQGPCNVQCMEDETGNLFLIELNPRLAAGGLPLTVKAGANIPEMMLGLALGLDIEPVKQIRPDFVMLRYLNDIFLRNKADAYKII